MFRVKIIGAGSLGNHVAHAARQLGWSVAVCDTSVEALRRMKDEIYPRRYGTWDPAIALHHADAAPAGGFDLIHVGTPPDSHLSVATQALRENPRSIVVEKPLCPPTSLDRAAEFCEEACASRTKVFIGYDYVVGKATRKVEELVRSGIVGEVHTLDVEFREHWQGILDAHPWLQHPCDSYLGFWRRGGGATNEHSHAVNLWQHFAHVVGAGRVTEVSAMLTRVKENGADYDSMCLLNLRTEGGVMGRVAKML